MSVWKNKHLLVATLMAPILALIAYFGVNYLVGEKPHAAEAGQTYKLVEKPNCRYASGLCGLKNGDFELVLDFEKSGEDRFKLKLVSVFPLEGVLLAVVEGEDDEKQPEEMQATGIDGLNWSLDIVIPNPESHRLRLVVSSNEALYFGDVATTFTLGEIGTNKTW
jgi:hypothetical protein